MKSTNFNKSLGDLEAEIMEVAWELDNVTVRNVLDKLRKKREIAYTTVMTIMSRLYAKGMLNRKLNDEGAYVYKPVQSKDSFLKSASKNAIDHLISEFGEIAVAQLANIFEGKDIKNLEDWRRKNKRVN